MFLLIVLCCCLIACQTNTTILSDAAQHQQQIAAFQHQMNSDYKDSLKSPLTEEDRLVFNALTFYPTDSSFRVKAKFRKKISGIFKMKTTTDRLPQYRQYGQLKFKLKAQNYVLKLYQNIALSKKEAYKDYLFLPFTDASNGQGSYGGGRYIDFKIPEQKWVVLDFNKAYNPYCAYNSRYSCPVPPTDNDIDIAVEAGVKAPPKH